MGNAPILGPLANGSNRISFWVMPRTYNADPQVARHKARKAAAVRDGRMEDAETADRNLRIAMFEKRLRELDEKLHAILAGRVTE
jgi:hypothetical protein